MGKLDLEIEELWDREVSRRYDVYKQQCVKVKDLEEVLRKYELNENYNRKPVKVEFEKC